MAIDPYDPKDPPVPAPEPQFVDDVNEAGADAPKEPDDPRLQPEPSEAPDPTPEIESQVESNEDPPKEPEPAPKPNPEAGISDRSIVRNEQGQYDPLVAAIDTLIQRIDLLVGDRTNTPPTTPTDEDTPDAIAPEAGEEADEPSGDGEPSASSTATETDRLLERLVDLTTENNETLKDIRELIVQQTVTLG